jgi:hypothetical protein
MLLWFTNNNKNPKLIIIYYIIQSSCECATCSLLLFIMFIYVLMFMYSVYHIEQGRPNGRSRSTDRLRTFSKSIMLEFIFRATLTKILVIIWLYTLYASMFLNNYSYSIIKKISMEVDPQRLSIFLLDRD